MNVSATGSGKPPQIDLEVIRKLDGALLGNYRGLLPGVGSELAETSPYQIGDDIRDMDWAATARTTVAQVRRRTADRELHAWIIVDVPVVSSELYNSTKDRLMRNVIAALSRPLMGNGSSVGAIFVGRHEVSVVPLGNSSAHLQALLSKLNRYAALKNTGTVTGLQQGISQLHSLQKRQGACVILSDFTSDTAWLNELNKARRRNDFLLVHIADAWDISLPLGETLTVTDPRHGSQRTVTVTSRMHQEFFRNARDSRRTWQKQATSYGIAVLALRTDRDWVADVLRFTALRRRGALPTGQNIEQGLIPADFTDKVSG